MCFSYAVPTAWNTLSPDFLGLCLVAQSCPILCDPMDCSPPGSSVHGDSPGKNNGMDCHARLQGIFSTQGLNQVSCITRMPESGPCDNYSLNFKTESIYYFSREAYSNLAKLAFPGKDIFSIYSSSLRCLIRILNII